MSYRLRLILAAAAVFAVMAAALVFGIPAFAQWRMTGFLRAAGFEQAHIGKTGWVRGGFGFGDIRLDNNGFSTIEYMALQSGNLTIDDAVLTGEWHKLILKPDVAGWSMPSGMKEIIPAMRK